MSRKQLFAALLSLLVCVPLHANAGFVSAAGEASGQGERSNEVNDEAANREFELFHTAEISLRSALMIAGKLRAGSRVADITFDGASGSPRYRVKTFQGNRVWGDTIDATTGQIVGEATVASLNDLDREDRSNLLALKAVRQELADAVLVAERSVPGKAIGGGLMNEDGKLKFVVVVLSGTSLKMVILEPPGANVRGARTRRPR